MHRESTLMLVLFYGIPAGLTFNIRIHAHLHVHLQQEIMLLMVLKLLLIMVNYHKIPFVVWCS